MRRLPVGAEVQRGGGTHFRMWATECDHPSVIVDGSEYPLSGEDDGYFSGFVPAADVGSRYGFRLGNRTVPDPASRFQPDGPHAPSCIIDPGSYEWRDQGWPGVSLRGQVIYELHVGSFTPEGTWSAAGEKLPLLVGEYEAALPPGGWPNWVLGNHDKPRIATRVGRDQARVAGMLLLTLRGTPTLYYGDEIGMAQVDIPPDRIMDPFERNVPGLGLSVAVAGGNLRGRIMVSSFADRDGEDFDGSIDLRANERLVIELNRESEVPESFG